MVLSLGLGSCNDSGEGFQRQVSFEFHHTMNVEESMILNAMVDEYREINPDVDITVRNVSFYDALDSYILASSAGNPPELFRAEISWIAGLVDQGYLLELSPFIGDGDLSDFLPQTLASGRYDGGIYGIPQVTDVLGLFFNKHLLSESGHTNPPRTLSELETIASDIKSATGKEGFMLRGSQGHWFLAFVFSFGGGMMAPDGTILINNDDSLAALEYIVQNKGSLFPELPDLASDYSYILEAFQNGEVGMIINGPWATASVLNAFSDPDNLGIAPLPEGPSGIKASPLGGHHYVISSTARYPQEIYEFIQFLTSPGNQARFALEANLLPTRSSTYDIPEVQENPIISAFKGQLDFGVAKPVHPQTVTMNTILSEYYTLAWRGELSPEDALDAVAREYAGLGE